MKVKRETNDLLNPRTYDGRRVTCVHARIEDRFFAGCFRETHHIAVELNAIRTGIGNIERYIRKVKKADIFVKEFFETLLPVELDLILDRLDEASDALAILEKQTKGEW